jgi:hypothetical protein
LGRKGGGHSAHQIGQATERHNVKAQRPDRIVARNPWSFS